MFVMFKKYVNEYVNEGMSLHCHEFLYVLFGQVSQCVVCDHKNKLFVEVGKGFFSKIFFKPLMPINVGTHLWENVGAGGLCELSPFVTRLLWMYTGS